MPDYSDKGPSVADGVIRWLSATRITQFDETQEGGCQRRWWFAFVSGKEQPESRSQALGTELHAQIERYGKTNGREDVLSPIVRIGQRWIPTGYAGLEWEHTFNGMDPHGRDGFMTAGAARVPMIGQIDLLNSSGFHINTEGELCAEHPRTVEVCDWKTSKNIAKWGKTGQALIGTTQMISYAKFAVRRDPTIENVRLSHVYFQTEGKREASKRTIVIPLAVIDARWKTVDETVNRMVQVATVKKVTEVTPNLTACNSFGGCPFRADCPRPVAGVLNAIFGDRSMSLLSKLRNQGAVPGQNTNAPLVAAATHAGTSNSTAATAAGDAHAAERARLLAQEQIQPVSAATPAPAVDHVVMPASGATAKRIYVIQVNGASAWGRAICRTAGDVYAFGLLDGNVARIPVSENVTEWAPAQIPPEVTATYARQDAALQAPAPVAPPKPAPVPMPAPAAIAPPDAPPSRPALAAVPIPLEQVPALPPAVQAALRPEHVTAPAGGAPAPAPVPAQAPVSTEPPKRKPGRPTKAEAEARKLAAQGAAQDNVTPESGIQEADRLTRTDDGTEPDAGGLELFINCYPSVPYSDLIGYTATIAKELADRYTAVDIRCAPENSPLGFSKWKGMLSAAVVAAPPEPGTYVIITRDSEIAAIVADALIPLASVYVRGV